MKRTKRFSALKTAFLASCLVASSALASAQTELPGNLSLADTGITLANLSAVQVTALSLFGVILGFMIIKKAAKRGPAN